MFGSQEMSGTMWSLNYVNSIRPLIKKKALFSDTTENFVIPFEPTAYDRITIRFRTAKDNVDSVYIVLGGERVPMLWESCDELFDYYYHETQLDNCKISYHFSIKSGKQIVYFDMRGVVNKESFDYDFVVIPGFSTPDWAKGAVMYQIYTDRFRNGDPGNDVLTNEYYYVGNYSERVTDWYSNPANMDIHRFYGGDLQGVMDKLDYLKDLGVEVIYFNPLFVSPSNHKYDIQDYDHIDPHFGRIVDDKGELLKDGDKENIHATKYINRLTSKANLDASDAFFAEFVSEAHKRGIRVILDGVFNHCGSFNKWMDRERIYENAEGFEKGAYITADSPYRSFFDFNSHGSWPYNRFYEGWWGHDTLPKLNYEGSQSLKEYILRIAKKWVSAPYNADGWRLDVAADLGHSPEYNHSFWQDFRKAVKEANPDAIILAEHYGDTRPWLQGNEWDSVMNYDAFMEPVTWFLTGMEKHSDDFRGDLLGNQSHFWASMQDHLKGLAMPSIMVAMNQLSNHDHSRFLTRTNHVVGRVQDKGAKAAEEGINKAVMREAVIMQMTWTGAPTLYYGDEAGVCGFTDPDNRRTYPWGREDIEMLLFHKAAIKIHRECPELKTGSLKFLDTDRNFIAYGRFDNLGKTIVLINNGNEDLERLVTVWVLGIPKEAEVTRLLYSDAYTFSDSHEKVIVTNGNINVTLPRTGAMILRYAE